MKGRSVQVGIGRSGFTQSILLLLSCLACFYVAGRLWQDAENRSRLVKLLQQSGNGREVKTVSEDEQLKLYGCKHNEKRLAELEVDLAAARNMGLMLRPAASKSKRLLAVIGINTGLGNYMRRHSVRARWMPSGADMRKLEEKGIVIRFVVGRSANRGDSSDRAIDAENMQTQDFLILDKHVETAEGFPNKAKEFFSTAFDHWDAEFYLKVDDDVFVDISKLEQLLASYSDKYRTYFGCMKSGDVVTEVDQHWYESEWWKFGDGKSYFQHANGQMYGVARPLAQYIHINRDILHTYTHEDISVGSWMLGLEAEYVDEKRFCCNHPPTGAICNIM